MFSYLLGEDEELQVPYHKRKLTKFEKFMQSSYFGASIFFFLVGNCFTFLFIVTKTGLHPAWSISGVCYLAVALFVTLGMFVGKDEQRSKTINVFSSLLLEDMQKGIEAEKEQDLRVALVSAESGKSERVQVSFLDKSMWHWNGACEVYCKCNDKIKDTLTEEDKNIIMEKAGCHIKYFVKWLKERDFWKGLQEDDLNVNSLAIEDIKEEFRPFVYSYYDRYLKIYCNRMKMQDRPLFLNGFEMKEYEEIKLILDRAYENFVFYCENPRER